HRFTTFPGCCCKWRRFSPLGDTRPHSLQHYLRFGRNAIEYGSFTVYGTKKRPLGRTLRDCPGWIGICGFSSSRCVIDGSLVMGNMMNAAAELGVASCWVHRAKVEFESEEGKAILKELGVEGDYEGRCITKSDNERLPGVGDDANSRESL
ncbi:MAG: nitroreductase family protein, partial [Oscillospiraceae bacterium]|nr:nitroreductase family protein [Oscillospiraceae bacterium]